MAEKTRLILLFGGQSCEHEVSVTSARSVVEAVDRERYDLTLVGIARDGRWWLQDDPNATFTANRVLVDGATSVYLDYCGGGGLRSTADQDLVRHADVVFPLLHGPHGEDGTIQGLLELAGIAYVGSGVVGSAVGMDKELMRRAFSARGLAQTPWMTTTAHTWKQTRERVVAAVEESLSYPMFVKPCNMGSSVGITKVRDARSLSTGVDFALGFDYKVMIEQSVENAREIECAVLGNFDPLASPCGEIVPGAEFYNYETKYIDDKSDLIIPARLADDCEKRLRESAVEAFKAVEAFGLARVDFLVTRDESRILVNEINTMPGFTPISMYPKLWREAGMGYAELIDRLIELAVERRAVMASLSNSI